MGYPGSQGDPPELGFANFLFIAIVLTLIAVLIVEGGQ
jgi:hypothetical protein